MNGKLAIRKLRRKCSPEHGQSILTLAISMFFFMGLLAVVGDTMLAYWQRRDLQNSADAAALAAAQLLPDEDAATTEANAKVTANEDAVEETEVTFGDNVAGVGATSVTVKVTKHANGLFGGIGFGSTEVTADATARIASPFLPGPGVVPMSISDEAYQACADDPGGPACDDVTLREYAQNNTPPQSSYQLLNLGLTEDGDGGAKAVCEFLIGGSTNPIEDPTQSQPGNVSSLHNCLIQRMVAAAAVGGTHPPACLTWDDVQDGGELRDECNPLSGAQRGADSLFPDAQPTNVVLIPVIDEFAQGSKPLDIIGSGAEPRLFAYFWIDPLTVYGSAPTCAPPGGGGGGGGNLPAGQCEIKGKFILEYLTVLTPNTGGNGEYDPNSLIKVVELIE